MRTVLLSEQKINDICNDIGGKISARLKDEKMMPVVVGVMKGGLNFTLELSKRLSIPVLMDYIQISSYEGTESTGIIHLKKDISLDLSDRTVIVVDDVIDTGYSMHYLKNYIVSKYHPKEVIVCCLVDKRSVRKIDVQIDYCGEVLNENKFLMGFGLDYKELYRNVPYVYIPDNEEIAEMDRIVRTDENR
jgi:hypoxanthine phosphoribosyltransferase